MCWIYLYIYDIVIHRSQYMYKSEKVKATSQRALAKIPQFRMRSNRKSADLARSAYGLFPDLSALSGILL